MEGTDTMQMAAREDYFAAVKLARETITMLDAMLGSSDPEDSLALVRVTDWELTRTALDRRDEFVWDDECKAAWAVKGDLMEAWRRLGNRQRLYRVSESIEPLRAEIERIRSIATRSYR